MSEQTENTAVAATEEKAEKAVNVNIIRGRMPIAVVAQVRFGKNKADSNKALADLYGTTVGKVDDIKKSRNFAYVTAEFKPTQGQIDEGIAWLQRHPKFSTGSVDAVIVELETTPVATVEDAAAFEAARVAARGQSTTTKTGEVADGGGGNRRAPRKSKKAADAVEGAGEAAETAGATAEALLS